MTWFKRISKGISTDTKEKKEVPDGLWHKCASCKETYTTDVLVENLYVCPKCQFHNRINAPEYFGILFDEGKFEELFSNIAPKDFLKFEDIKPYETRLVAAQKQTGLKDAMTVGVGTINGKKLVIACMNFNFIGGSMGSVVGEKISRAIDYSIKHKHAFMIISKSGGARMMESAFSLMQMAKTSAKLTQLANAKLPYISLLTDPTTGGVTASFAMLGDINIAEPKALIGFAGPRIIKETIRKDLPAGFQRSEFLLDHGFLDFVVERKDLKQKLTDTIEWFGTK
ncbi:acetyl-CoA carboxylase carboxyl transferase subunit beta [Taibaiella sp. KBW10]|uniref:acetyl-CoA carboxylase, carboxyltransferase subunit beta n=1 Tax=Taibaiella sp. KBW10 TaxID=2153357 RepID=UPI000F5B3888|nr:acetyl-CoA carboxylase, carboxyltransferase subunit beta [Taibaiella sp. KBW10]RQO30445.1 acetyl-CoA carboxylase carboxyl transferase subunit beta [Taibaiella sp. KBW10]